MKTRKIIAFLLAAIMLLGVCSSGAFASFGELGEAKASFQKGAGPETDGYSIDYRYYSPVKEGDKTRYPVVIWLHGMGNGKEEGEQIVPSDIALWATAEYQSRFKGSKGAFVIAPRSLEEKGLFWDDCLIHPLRAALDDFIIKHKANVDLSRIYIGGYSMGGKMTLKMAVAYPEMFAAIFPICPAWLPSTSATARLADMPVWLTSGVTDPLVNYFSMVMTTWNNIIAESNVAEDCRFSTLKNVLYPNGRLAPSGHHSWFAVNYDMFSLDNGDYPSLKTVDGNGDKVKLVYPDGMISWLSGFESDFDGTKAADGGNSEAYGSDASSNVFATVINFFKNLIAYIFGK